MTTLGQRFQLLGELGRGGMGVVYRAREVALDREVALKVVRRELTDPEARARFEREGRLAASLRHPGIVAVHGAGELEGALFIAYELVPGARTLDAVLPERDRAGRVALVLEAARALAHAHAGGVVHRDVKPANILVAEDGRVRVTDFGLATALELERLTRTGELLGTPAYMAPEQLNGERAASPATDVWALGAVLYQALTGELPFRGTTLIELAQQVLEGSGATPPRRLDPTIPAPLEAVVLAALERDADHRPRDAGAFAALLEAALGAAPRARSRRLVGAALAGLVGALGAAAWAATRPAPEAPRPATEVAAPGTATGPAQPPPPPAPTTSEVGAVVHRIPHEALAAGSDKPSSTLVRFVSSRHLFVHPRSSGLVTAFEVTDERVRRVGAVPLRRRDHGTTQDIAVHDAGGRRRVLATRGRRLVVLAEDVPATGDPALALEPRRWWSVPQDARPIPDDRERRERVFAIEPGPDGLLAVGGEWQEAFLVSASGALLARLPDLEHGVRCFAFAGPYLLVGVGAERAQGAEVRAWSLAERRWRCMGHGVSGTIYQLAVDGDRFVAAVDLPHEEVDRRGDPGARLAQLHGGAIQTLLDPEGRLTSRTVATDEVRPSAGRGVRLLPGRGFLVLTTFGPRALSLWEVELHLDRPRWAGPIGDGDARAFSLDVSPDGRWVAVGFTDGRASVWRTDALLR